MALVREFRQLWNTLIPRRQLQFWLLILVMMLASFAEIFSLGAVLPFLGVITDPEIVFEHPVMQPFIRMFAITEAKDLILPFTIIFILSAT